MKQAIAIVVTVAILGIIGFETTKTKSNTTSQPATTTAPQAVSASTGSAVPASTTASPSAKYRDGTYTGSNVDNEFGSVEVAAVIRGGRITDIKFLKMPSDMGHSRMVSQYSLPILRSETISAQSANIDFVSGATATSDSFERSLQAALNQAVKS